MILDIVFSVPDNSRIIVVTDTGNGSMAHPFNPRNELGREVQAWVDAGNSIGAYDEFYLYTVDSARETKKVESDAYAQALIDAAFENPQQGVTVNKVNHRRQVETRRAGKADKSAGEIALSQAEKDEAKIDQKLSEYENKVWTDNDKVHTNIDAIVDNVSMIMAYDISTSTNWNVWTPPV